MQEYIVNELKRECPPCAHVYIHDRFGRFQEDSNLSAKTCTALSDKSNEFAPRVHSINHFARLMDDAAASHLPHFR